MDCNRSNELISLSLDDMLTDQEQIELNEHLESCDQCKEDYTLYQSIQEGLGEIEEVELPVGFHEELMGRIEKTSVDPVQEDKVTPLWQRLNRRYINVAAAFVLVVVFALIGFDALEEGRNSSDMAMPEMAVEKAAVMEDSTLAGEPKMASDNQVEQEAARTTAFEASEEAMTDEAALMDASVLDNADSESDMAASGSNEASDSAESEEAGPEAELDVTTDDGEEMAIMSFNEETSPTLTRTEETGINIHTSSVPSQTYPYFGWWVIGGFMVLIGLGSWIILKVQK